MRPSRRAFLVLPHVLFQLRICSSLRSRARPPVVAGSSPEQPEFSDMALRDSDVKLLVDQ